MTWSARSSAGLRQAHDRLTRLDETLRETLKRRSQDASALLERRLQGTRDAMEARLRGGRELSLAIRETEALSPLAILGRGYSVAYGEDGCIVKGIGGVMAGESITIRTADGKIAAAVKGVYTV